ncbi:MAG: hypothetical protein FD123_1905 [Bacteroidetes bacterium]|nr:MAG: hypothetical protein FD123_1905 [Bacteroidota bacterium]
MKKLYTLIFSVLVSFTLFSQVVLNEFCSANRGLIPDFSGDRTDWLEIYNPGTSAVSLSGYSLSDDPQIQQQWVFQGGTIPAQGYLIVFLSGKNLQAPEFHTGFKLSSEGEEITLRDAAGNIVDQLDVEEMHANDSWGRQPDGAANYFFFDIPTPGASNNSSAAWSGYLEKVRLNPAPGFYSQPVLLSISSSDPNIEIRYTLNGSEPGPASALYTAPVWISWHTAIRARAFPTIGNELPSQTVTGTYFINLDSRLPVISIIADSLHLFSNDSGLFMPGPNASPNYPYYGANFWQDWEYPAHIEYYNANRQFRFRQELGMQINGGSASRSKPMKALRLIARDKYGDDDIDQQFFPQKNISSFKLIVLRNASGDFCKVHFRDAYVHDLLLKGGLDVDVLAYQPAVALVNGTYWGVYNIRERVSKYYLEENYGINGDSVDILEEDTLIVQGDYTQFNAMKNFILSNDMSVNALYDSAAGMMDISSLCDYYITETYFSNIDWPYNNIKFWKQTSPGHKWRYILLDLDITLGNFGWAPYDMDVLGRILGPYGDNNQHVQILKALLANTGFRHYFINRYADLVNTLFSTPSMLEHLAALRDNISTDMQYHMPRWGYSYSDWENEMNNIAVPYIENRPGYAMNFVRDTFHLAKKTELTLDVWPPGAGEIRINTIQPGPLPWRGTYFDGVPVTLTAVPGPGHEFEYWRSEKIIVQPDENVSVTFNPDTADVITAYFSPRDNTSDVIIFPNPVPGDAQAGFRADAGETAVAEISDALGRIVFTSPGIICTAGFNMIELPAAGLRNGIYFLQIVTESKKVNTRFVKM